MYLSRFISRGHREVLKRARETYGNGNQIQVSIGELCELGAVCSKFHRYKTREGARKALYGEVLDELADVLIVLDHIAEIFEVDPRDLERRVDGKVQRLEKWLDTSSDMEQTTRYREVPGQIKLDMSKCKPKTPCGTCDGYGNFLNLKPGGRCPTCVSNNYSLYKRKEDN